MSETDKTEIYEALDRARQRRDHDQFWQELSGRETGRARRFVRREDTDLARAFKEADAIEFLYFIGMTLGQRITRLHTRLDILNDVTAEALQEAQKQVREAAKRLNDLESAASTDRLGRRVYRTADGRTAFYEDETELSPQERDQIEWRPGSPTWEQRTDALSELSSATSKQQELIEFQQRLDEHAQRLEDDPSAATVSGIEKDLEDIPESVKQRLAQRVSEAKAETAADAALDVRGASPTARAFNESVVALSAAVTATRESTNPDRERDRAPPENTKPGAMP